MRTETLTFRSRDAVFRDSTGRFVAPTAVRVFSCRIFVRMCLDTGLACNLFAALFLSYPTPQYAAAMPFGMFEAKARGLISDFIFVSKPIFRDTIVLCARE